MAIEWKDLYKAAKKTAGPTYKQLKKMDRDDWLASIGLERRNVGADILGAVGLIAVGCGVGFALGMLFAPKRGEELRREWGDKLKPGKLMQEKKGVQPPSGYAS